MIHPSRRWRFINQLEDRGYCEDEVVQHNVTELRALRRSFSEKFTEDEVAVEEVRKQTKIAARCNPPALPRLFALEKVEGYLTLVTELVEGVQLETLVEKKRFAKSREWVEFAISLTNELIELRNQDVKFERLDYKHLVVTDSNEIRITTRQPVGKLDAEVLAESKFLKRFEIRNQGGVYTAPGKPDEQAELWAIREILANAACEDG